MIMTTTAMNLINTFQALSSKEQSVVYEELAKNRSRAELVDELQKGADSIENGGASTVEESRSKFNSWKTDYLQKQL
jgi:hypothetical protein